MECNKWQEEGLLYVCREMDAAQTERFKKHVQFCDCCRNEIDQYMHDKKAFFCADMLCESPSGSVDKKIITACSRMPKYSWSIPLLSTVWFKRTLISMVFLVFGTGAGVYFTINYYNAAPAGNALASHKTHAPAIAYGSLSKSRDSSLSDKKDSLKQKENMPFINRQQRSQPQQGVFTVDLKKE